MKPVLNLFRNMALVVTLAITTLLVAEYAIRWLIPVPDWKRDVHLGFQVSRPDLPDLGTPNAKVRMAEIGEYDLGVQFNRHGLRDKRDITEAEADEIIFLGDSQTFGFGVQTRERFSELVGDKLGVVTYNLSAPTDVRGYKQLLEFAAKNGARARRLVVGLSMETDIRAYPPPGQSESASDAPVEVAEGPVAVDPVAEQAQPTDPVDQDLKTKLMPLKIWLKDHSALYFAVTNLVHQSPVLRNLAVDAGLIIPVANAWDPQVIEQTAAALQDLCTGYSCTVAIIPSRALWLSKDPRTEARVHETLVGRLRARGLSVVDPRSRMEAEGAPLKYFFPVDGHLNVLGNALVAEMIAREDIAGLGSEERLQTSVLFR